MGEMTGGRGDREKKTKRGIWERRGEVSLIILFLESHISRSCNPQTRSSIPSYNLSFSYPMLLSPWLLPSLALLSPLPSFPSFLLSSFNILRYFYVCNPLHSYMSPSSAYTMKKSARYLQKSYSTIDQPENQSKRK